MKFSAMILMGSLLASPVSDNICIPLPQAEGQRATCCVNPDGRQCCSGSVENGKPVGCDCMVDG